MSNLKVVMQLLLVTTAQARSISSVKYSQLAVIVVSAVTAVGLVACGSEDAAQAPTVSSTEQAPTTQAQQVPLPTAEDLNAVLATAIDPNAPIEAKIATVQNGDQAPELFGVMTASKIESGADFQVVQPILPGYTDNSVLATVILILPEREAQPSENVEFVYENGTWKLSQSWACTLISNTVEAEQIPAMCLESDFVPGPESETPAAAESTPAS